MFPLPLPPGRALQRVVWTRYLRPVPARVVPDTVDNIPQQLEPNNDIHDKY